MVILVDGPADEVRSFIEFVKSKNPEAKVERYVMRVEDYRQLLMLKLWVKLAHIATQIRDVLSGWSSEDRRP